MEAGRVNANSGNFSSRIPGYIHILIMTNGKPTCSQGSEKTTRPSSDIYYRGGQPPAILQQSTASAGNKTGLGADSGVNGTANVLQPPPVVVASSSSSDRGEGDNDEGGGRHLKDGSNDKDDSGGGRSSLVDGQDDGGGIGGSAGAGYASFPLALAVAIGIGCSLLFLNLMIFAVIYYNKSTGWGGRRGSSRRTSGLGTGSDAEDLQHQQQQDDRIRKIKKRPENGGPMSNLCSTGGISASFELELS